MRLVECPHCKAVNRLKHYSLKQMPSCGRCHMPLPEPSYLKISRAVLKAKFWIVLAAILGGAYLSGTFDTKPSHKSATTAAYIPAAPSHAYNRPELISDAPKVVSPKTAFNQPAIPIQQGIHHIFTRKSLVAPLEVITPVGSEQYYVKLVDAQTDKSVMTFFIYGGQSFEAKVPFGTYRLKYAAGKTWYGDEHLFGPDTTYSKAEQDFEFYRQGNQVAGYTVELILQRNGNLHTTEISASEF